MISTTYIKLEFCGGPTPKPTSLSPTISDPPTKTPTKNPTFEPTSIPSMNPSEVPTRSPVSATVRPVPTASPVDQEDSEVEVFAAASFNIETTDGSISNENVADVIPVIEDTIDIHLPDFASCSVTKMVQGNGVTRSQLGFTVLFDIFIDVLCTENPCNCDELGTSKYEEALSALTTAVQDGLLESTMQQSGNNALSAVQVVGDSLSPEETEIVCKTLSPTTSTPTKSPSLEPTLTPTMTPNAEFNLVTTILDAAPVAALVTVGGILAIPLLGVGVAAVILAPIAALAAGAIVIPALLAFLIWFFILP